MRRILFIVLVLFCNLNGYSKQDLIRGEELDSLLLLTDKVKDIDLEYFNQLNEISVIYFLNNLYKESKTYLLKAEDVAIQLNDVNKIIQTYPFFIQLGTDDLKREQIITSIKNHLSDLSVFDESGLSVFLSIASELSATGRYQEGMEIFFFLEKELKKRTGVDFYLSRLSIARSEIFTSIKDFNNAEKNAIEAKQYAEKTGVLVNILISKLSLAWVFDKAENYSKSIEIYQELLNDSLPNLAIRIQVLLGLNQAFFNLGQFELSYKYAEEGLEVAGSGHRQETYLKLMRLKSFQKFGNKQMVLNDFKVLENLIKENEKSLLLENLLIERGKFNIHHNQYKEALVDLNIVYDSLKIGRKNQILRKEFIETLKILSEANTKLGKYKVANFYQQKIIDLREESIKEAADIKGIRYATNIILEKNEKEQKLLSEKNKQQTNLIWLVGLLAISFLVFGGIIWKQSRRISKEKKRTEELLLNMLPASIARRMQTGEISIADKFENASVVFIDMVDFTTLSSTTSPEKIIELLNVVFSKMDFLTEQFHMEKIKTIGDCYMAVAGIPQPINNHLENAIDFCLAVLEEIDGKEFISQKVNLRIGIETGPVIAGVIGKKRFLFDLWGDTVNTASRMETNGISGNIQTTRRVFDKIKDKYPFQSRGFVNIKGKGDMEVFVLGKD